MAKSPKFGKMFRRGLVRRCPWCGNRHAFFHSWIKKDERCQGCGLRWDRGTDGQELGAVVINLILTVAVVVVGLGLVLWASYPGVPAVGLAIGGILGSAVVYALVYPIGFTVYHAIDLAVRGPEPEEMMQAEEWLAARRA